MEQAWEVTGVLQRTTRHNVRDDMVIERWGEGIDSVSVFRVNKDAEQKENLGSPLKSVKSPTLMEIKELPSSFLEDTYKLRREHQCLINTKMIVDSSECVNRLGQLLTRMLVELMGRKLERVPEDARKLLIGGNGPFAGRKKLKRTCGTYFELMQHHMKHPNARFAEYLRSIEGDIIRKFSRIPTFPTEPEGLRSLLYTFVQTARELRNVHSHIGLLPQDAKERALQLIEENLGSLEESSLQSIIPLVSAGVYILRHGIPYNVEEDVDGEEAKEEELAPTPTSGLFLPQQTCVTVKFIAKKKLQLGYAVSVFGYHSLLGKGLPDKAIQMACEDGLTWSKVIKLPIDVDIEYSFIIVRKRKASKWEMIDGPFGQFTVHVGALPMTLETNLEDVENGEESMQMDKLKVERL